MKIPDDVFRNRCAWCIHRNPGRDNIEILEREMYLHSIREKTPCLIIGVCRPNRIKGECESFYPMHIYGICYTCAHYNNFFEDTDCCTLYERPNRHRVYAGDRGGVQAALFTCDRYTPSKYNLNNARQYDDPDPIMTYAWCNTEAFQENDFCSKGKRREE